MSNLLWKKKRKKKWKPKQKERATGQWKWRKNKEKKKKKKKEKLEHCWTQHIEKKRKKERTDIFSKIDSTSLHRLKKKEEKKTEHFWTVVVILFWLVVKWNFLSLFEFEGDIRNFFSCSYYEIWRKPLTEDFILGLMMIEIILILKIFFRIWGFRGIGNIFLGGGFCFWGNRGWRENRTDIHPIGFRLLMGRRQRK